MSLPNPTDVRPWGGYQNLFSAQGGSASGGEASGYLVKLFEVAPGHRLSLQRHFKREEFWIVISGDGLFELDGASREITPGSMLHVGITQLHRVTNRGMIPLLILEVQKGECREDDIERLADDYQRISTDEKNKLSTV